MMVAKRAVDRIGLPAGTTDQRHHRRVRSSNATASLGGPRHARRHLLGAVDRDQTAIPTGHAADRPHRRFGGPSSRLQDRPSTCSPDDGAPPMFGFDQFGNSSQDHTTSDRSTMIILGIILLLIGYFTSLSILYTIGGILVVVGIVLWILGAVGRPVGGRKVWF
ncbi:hypothetical protein [Mycolicibacterium austroafricanum]|uniref:hypothetical protein n=1 Tax=Mycolicibacterium austroafricanum TaxID=39687 RepID=UPI001CA31932|nr:hypothetical protein [Mycolicibacterium austroafricanum]QZT65879.1 hypothetical protein JN085_09160 [Mycolicibacterium austroafricanum]